MNQLERPQYYEGEYLGAEDLAAIVQYARIAGARHALGAHIWGIAIGLDLAERALSGGDVEMLITPGAGWDGYGRPIVAPVPQRLGLDLFRDFTDNTAPEGVRVEVWLRYRELPSRPPGTGFSCPPDELYGRIIETYSIELRRIAVTDLRSVEVASRTMPAAQALKTFDSTRPVLFDESVPQQRFPETGNNPPWPVFVGHVRWRKDAGHDGRLIQRTVEDRNETRRLRRYIGVVAESVLAPGVLRLRNRADDPASATVNFKAPTEAGPNDLVWCEGHLRVVGDTRLQDGKLDYLVAGGGDDGVPMQLRRRLVTAPVRKTTLDAFVAPPAPPPGPANAQTRFAVSTIAQGQPKERLTVVTDGRVGINADEPTNTLQVDGPTGIRYDFGYLTGDKGAAWTAFAFNAYTPPGGPWVIPDGAHRSVAVVLDDAGGVPECKVQTNNGGGPNAWDVQLVVKGDTGNVGIGNAAPTAKLHVHSANAAQGDIQLFSGTADFEYDGGSDKLFIFRDTGGKTAFLGGDIGIGTATPAGRLHVAKDAHLNVVLDRTDLQEHLTAVVGSAGSGLRFSDTNAFFVGSQPYGQRGDTSFGTEHLRITSAGSVGIGTSVPLSRVHVAQDAHLNVIFDRTDTNDHLTAVVGSAGSGLRFGSGNDFFIGSQAYANRADGSFGNEHLRIKPNGRVGIGTNNPQSTLHVAGNMQLNGSAFVINGGFWKTSDRRAKTGIEGIESALDRLMALRGVSFQWRDDAQRSAHPGRHLGFIAQDVEAVFPEMVTDAPDGTKATNMSGIDAIVVEAIREIIGRCERLAAEIATLRSEQVQKMRAPRRSKRRSAPVRRRGKTRSRGRNGG